MQFSTIFSIISSAVVASAITVSYDPGYDIPSRSLNELACSDGANGLVTRFGWTTQQETSNFPNIGGVVAVANWDSPACGTCWRLEYEGNSVNILAVDHSAAGYNIGLTAMDALTNGQGEQLGRIEAEVTQVDASECGVPEE